MNAGTTSGAASRRNSALSLTDYRLVESEAQIAFDLAKTRVSMALTVLFAGLALLGTTSIFLNQQFNSESTSFTDRSIQAQTQAAGASAAALACDDDVLSDRCKDAVTQLKASVAHLKAIGNPPNVWPSQIAMGGFILALIATFWWANRSERIVISSATKLEAARASLIRAEEEGGRQRGIRRRRLRPRR